MSWADLLFGEVGARCLEHLGGRVCPKPRMWAVQTGNIEGSHAKTLRPCTFAHSQFALTLCSAMEQVRTAVAPTHEGRESRTSGFLKKQVRRENCTLHLPKSLKPRSTERLKPCPLMAPNPWHFSTALPAVPVFSSAKDLRSAQGSVS